MTNTGPHWGFAEPVGDGPKLETTGASGVRPAGTALAREAARYAGLGWMRATSGNLSVVSGLDPLRLVVTASGVDKGELTAADVVEVDAAGQPVETIGPITGPTGPAGPAHGPSEPAHGRSGPARPSAEATLHARLVTLTGARAVVHLHTMASVLAAEAYPGGLVLRGLEMLKALARAAEEDTVRLPVVANSQDMTELGDLVRYGNDPSVHRGPLLPRAGRLGGRLHR